MTPEDRVVVRNLADRLTSSTPAQCRPCCEQAVRRLLTDGLAHCSRSSVA